MISFDDRGRESVVWDSRIVILRHSYVWTYFVAGTSHGRRRQRNDPRRGRGSLLWTTLIIRKTPSQRGPFCTPIGGPNCVLIDT